MTNKECRRHRIMRHVWPGRLQLAIVALMAALMLAACGTPAPTDEPTVVVVVTSPVPATAVPTRAPTEVPTATLAPTDTPSPLPPTATPVPTATPEPTATPIPPTDTPPPPTDTPVPPTDTAIPPTRTPAPPTKTPRPPTATVPPAPRFAWRGQVVNTFANCSLTRIMGLTLDRGNGIAGDVWVYTWADGWEGAWSVSRWNPDEGYAGMDDSSNWDAVLGTYAKAGTWKSCVVPAEGSRDCLSNTVTSQTTSEPCAPDSEGVQVVRIVFQLN
jgi:hypothetical protein